MDNRHIGTDGGNQCCGGTGRARTDGLLPIGNNPFPCCSVKAQPESRWGRFDDAGKGDAGSGAAFTGTAY